MRLQLLHFHAVFKTYIVSERGAGVKVISVKIETYRVTKVKICLVKYED